MIIYIIYINIIKNYVNWKRVTKLKTHDETVQRENGKRQGSMTHTRTEQSHR